MGHLENNSPTGDRLVIAWAITSGPVGVPSPDLLPLTRLSQPDWG